MIIKFEPKGLQLLVICGPGEKYEPTPEILALHDKLEEARKKLSEKEAEIAKFNSEYLEPIAKEAMATAERINLELNPQLAKKR